MAQLESLASPTEVLPRSLGLSRDGLSLAWSARRLLAAGKKGAALKLYGQALRIASRGVLSRTVAPRFNDDPGARRYLLPGEERARGIVGELISQSERSFQDWSAALPRDATVLLAAARLLREQGQNESDKLLDLILDGTGLDPGEDEAGALAHAARAEVFAIRSRWREAAQEYHQAIELMDIDLIRRSWWFNLAEVAFRLDDEDLRQTALRAALALETSDDITRRATLIQRTATANSRQRFGGAKAD
jgi:hypothetical protein